MIDHSKVKGITLIPTKSVNTIEELGSGVFCDFYVEGIEVRGHEITGGYQLCDLVNIDHHAPNERMAQVVSSAPLAIDYRAENGITEGRRVVINHTDADSILSSGITAGVLEPEERFAEAAIAADHTGVENAIADLLQPLASFKDPALSFRNLELLLDGKALEPEVEKARARRREDRKVCAEVAPNFKRQGRVCFLGGHYFEEVELFLPLFPDAEIFLIHYPSRIVTGKNEIRVRLGPAAPKGLWLNKLGLPNFGGRWNAGSSRRSEKTLLTVEEYASVINEKVEAFLGE
ncbi:MAG: hypothetical protein Q7R93_04930 [bacterium]|nr:hypothetical protein [bacterium]